jgi:hypothetical protein
MGTRGDFFYLNHMSFVSNLVGCVVKWNPKEKLKKEN